MRLLLFAWVLMGTSKVACHDRRTRLHCGLGTKLGHLALSPLTLFLAFSAPTHFICSGSWLATTLATVLSTRTT